MPRDRAPWILGGAAIGGVALWLAQRARLAAPLHASGPSPATNDPIDWLWPVPITDGYRPVVSDGFGSPRDGRVHAGVDLMFLRTNASDQITRYPPNTPNGTRMYFMPDGVLAIAAAPGRVWSAYPTTRGHQVVIDHGSHATLYQHLAELLIPTRDDGPGGPHVDAAHPLGVVGGDISAAPHLKHLHFEVWRGATPFDPEPLMRRWSLLEIRDAHDPDAIVVAMRGAAVTTRAPGRVVTFTDAS